MDRKTYMKKGLLELRKIAAYLSIADWADMRKAELVEAILAHPNPVESVPEEPTPVGEKKRRGRPVSYTHLTGAQRKMGRSLPDQRSKIDAGRQ